MKRFEKLVLLFALTQVVAWTGCNAILGNGYGVDDSVAGGGGPDGSGGGGDALVEGANGGDGGGPGSDARVNDGNGNPPDAPPGDAAGCPRGICPTPIGSLVGPQRLAVNAAGVYWASATDVGRFDLAGGNLKQLAPSPGAVVAAGLKRGIALAPNGTPYITSPGSSKNLGVCDAALTSCAPTSIPTTLGDASSVFADATHVTVGIGGGLGGFYQTPLSGTPSNGSGLSDAVLDLQVVGSEIYYRTTTVINRAQIAGAATQAADLQGEAPVSFVIHANTLVATTAKGLRTCALTAAPCATTVVLLTTTAGVVTTDGTYIFWIEVGAAGSVHRCDFPSCANPLVLAEGQASPSDLVVDATDVYWANYGDAVGNNGAVMKIKNETSADVLLFTSARQEGSLTPPMPTEIEGIVDSLRNLERADDVNQAYATVDRWNREARTADLLALHTAIEEACDADASAEARFPFEAVADHVEEVLALTAGSDHIDALFALLAHERVRSVQRARPLELRVRAFASRLAHGQSKDALNATIKRLGDKAEHTEVLACWMHETVLRGTSLDREPAVVAFHERLAAGQHPLGGLPLTLLDAETEAPTYMPMYGANAISKAVARLESGPTSTRTIPPPGEHEAPKATRIDDPAIDVRLRDAIGPWTHGSNGKVEAKVFRLEPALASASPGRWLLRALPLDCMQDASELVRAERTGADAVWGALFAAAANGGAYTSGLGGAYGRRAAWTSLAALVDAPLGATPKQIDARAPSAQFLMFGAPGGWWNDIAWDIGLLAVRPGGATVAVLAATDAD